MATTPNQHNFHFPDYSDSPDVPKDISLLAKDIADYIDANPGPEGPAGPITDLEVGTVSTVPSTTPASVTITGTAPSKTINFVLPRGVDGIIGGDGPSNVLTVGTVSLGNAGTTPIVTITGTSPSQVINFTIPKGDTGAQGPAGPTGPAGPASATLALGSVSTGAAGSNVVITNSGTTSAAVFNFTIPRGDTGATGAAGPAGADGLDGAPGANANLDPIDTRISLQIPNSASTGVNSTWYPLSSSIYSIGKDASDGGTIRKWKDGWFSGQLNAATVVLTGAISASAFNTVSDRNLKKDIQDSDLGLDFINSLNPVKYKYITGAIFEGPAPDGGIIQTKVPGVRTHYGLIAQEVKEAIDAAGIEDFGGWLEQEDETQALRYEQFISPLIKAVQELTARVKYLEEQ